MEESENKSHKTLAIIPARRGSVGLPGKNYIKLNGQPLIEYTIIEAIKSDLIDDIIISTDCPEIIKICEKFGDQLEVLVRPTYLAQSDSKSEDVVMHACDYFINKGALIENIVLLQPTSPIRSAAQIDESLSLFIESGKPSLISVTEPMQHPFDFLKESDGDIDYICSRGNVSRRQDFIKSWFINGSIYITSYEYFRTYEKLYDVGECLLYEMPIESSVDIDTLFDLEFCKFIMDRINENTNE